jgi:hypothetical protein
MTVLLGALAWLGAIAFVLALCSAAKAGDRRMRRNLLTQRTPGGASGTLPRQRVTVGS